MYIINTSSCHFKPLEDPILFTYVIRRLFVIGVDRFPTLGRCSSSEENDRNIKIMKPSYS